MFNAGDHQLFLNVSCNSCDTSIDGSTAAAAGGEATLADNTSPVLTYTLYPRTFVSVYSSMVVFDPLSNTLVVGFANEDLNNTVMNVPWTVHLVKPDAEPSPPLLAASGTIASIPPNQVSVQSIPIPQNVAIRIIGISTAIASRSTSGASTTQFVITIPPVFSGSLTKEGVTTVDYQTALANEVPTYLTVHHRTTLVVSW